MCRLCSYLVSFPDPLAVTYHHLWVNNLYNLCAFLKILQSLQCEFSQHLPPLKVDVITCFSFQTFQFQCDMDVCPYCRVKFNNEKKEHLKIHKTLKHKVLPVQFQSVSLANSAVPLIQDFFRPLDSSTKLWNRFRNIILNVALVWKYGA